MNFTLQINKTANLNESSSTDQLISQENHAEKQQKKQHTIGSPTRTKPDTTQLLLHKLE